MSLIIETGKLIERTIKSGNKVLTLGNGGSAADALHLAEELVGHYAKERPSWPAVCLASDPTLITCIANDYGFEKVFSRQIEGIGKPQDILIVFTTSGNSPNVIQALKTARKLGINTIALLGKDGGVSKSISDYQIIVPSNETARIQEVHTFILHCWMSQLEGGVKIETENFLC